MTEVLEEVRAKFEVRDIGGALRLLRECVQVYDLEHVGWFREICEREDRTVVEVQAEALRLLNGWATNLQAFVGKDGVPPPDPLRDELIDSAVTFLEDEQVKERSIEEKVQFLLEKGLNRTEIQIACAQVGIEPPASLKFSEPLRQDMVENGASFLKLDDLKGKSFEEKLAFLKSKGMTNPEIIRACEVAEMERIPTVDELNGLKRYKARKAREDMIKNGAMFLKHESVTRLSVKERLEFLRNKGMIGEEIEKACERAELPLTPELREEFVTPSVGSDQQEDPVDQPQQSDETTSRPIHLEDQKSDPSEENHESEDPSIRDDMVNKGVTFLTHQSVQQKSTTEKLQFLRNKGLTEPEIQRCCKLSNTPYEKALGNTKNVQNAVKFLQHPSAQSKPMREKIQFLRSKGLSQDEIKHAFRETGIETNLVSGIRMNQTSSDDQDQDYDDEDVQAQETEKTKFASKQDQQLLKQAKGFLLNANAQETSNEEKIKFLLGKGLSMDLIKEAFSQVGLGWQNGAYDNIEAAAKNTDTGLDKIEQAKRFLQNEKISGLTNKQKAGFLKRQGFNQEQIEQVFAAAGMTFEGIPTDDDEASAESNIDPSKLIQSAITFLLKTKARPMDERVAFLKKQGLSDEQIDKAFEEAKLPKQNPGNEQVQKALQFLATTETMPMQQRMEFLKRQGISDSDIDEAIHLAGIDRDAAPVDPLVQQGVQFLKNPKSQASSVRQRQDFLLSKGLTKEQVGEAFRLAGISMTEQHDRTNQTNVVEEAVRFFNNPATHKVSAQQRIQYLREKGLTENEIKMAIEQSRSDVKDILARATTMREEYIERGAAFLVDPKVKDVALEDRVEYLQTKAGLTEEEILEAAIRAKIDLVPSNISTIPMRVLKKDRFEVPKNLDPAQQMLQRVMNTVVDLLLRIETHDNHPNTGSSESSVLGARAMTLLATTLCRARPARISPACVAFSARVVPRALEKGSMDSKSSMSSTSLTDMQSFLEAHMELVARASEINTYAKEGLKQQQQVNLYFISNVDILSLIIKLWRDSETITFAHGILVSRAVHGHYFNAASVQPFKVCGKPVVDFVVSQLASTKQDCSRGVAAYIAAGLLRGAPDYAWGTDVPKSPHPYLQGAVQKAAKDAIFDYEKLTTPTVTLKAPQHVIRARGTVVAIGLSSVYCDSQLEWTTSVFQTVMDGLLHGALWSQECFGVNSELSLDERAANANEFVKQELFKLAPQLVSLVLSKMSKENKTDASKLQLAWTLSRLHRFSTTIYLAMRRSNDLASVIARRTVHLVYGTGKEGEEEQQPQPENPPEDDLVTIKPEDEDEDDDDDEEEDEDGDDEEKEQTTQSTAKKSQQSQEDDVDPLRQYLGVHSGLTRLLQMGYLATVIIGQTVLTRFPGNLNLVLMTWDALANLNAFQVRVQDTIDLEELLKVLIQLAVGNDHQRLGLTLFSLFKTHVEHSETAVINPGEHEKFDWVLGARLEYLLSSAESWLLDAYLDTANLPSPSSADEDIEDTLPKMFPQFSTYVMAKDILLAEELETKRASASKKRKKKAMLPKEKERENEQKPFSATDLHIEVNEDSLRFFGAGMCQVLLDVGVRHPFVHLNMRVHRWMTDMIGKIKEDGGSKVDELVLAPTLRLSCIPRYVQVSLESHPHGTPSRVLAFVVGSILTSLGKDPDERAQSLSVMAYDRIALAVDDRVAKRPPHKKDGPQLTTLLFTALKAISATVLPVALNTCEDLIQRSESQGELEGDGELDLDLPLIDRLTPMTREWFMESLFGVISRTNDTPRRLQLAMWYLTKIQHLTIGGNL